MAIFRKSFLVVMLLALAGTLANAQIGFAVPGSASPLNCSAFAGMALLRPEGFTERVGDILITCTGGTALPLGSQVPRTNITLFMSPVNITSRLLDPLSGLSEALLLIDDPGSSLPTGASGLYGPKAPQSLCASMVGCAAFAQLDGSGVYPVASTTAEGGTNAANVYQGYVGAAGDNTVTFWGVPVLPPELAGVQRTFRITNLRVPTVGLAEQQQISAFLSASNFAALPVPAASSLVGQVGPPMTATVDPAPAGGASPFAQCVAPGGATLAAKLHFSERLGTGFKTRVVPLTDVAWASTLPNTGTPGQNIPGNIFYGSESGFILPAATATIGPVTYVAGLADFGTRLKAVFTNIPAGIKVYVSTTNANGYAVPGGTGITPYAVLVAGNQSDEANTDGAVITPLSSGAVPGSDGLTAVPLTPDASGSATAVWEVVNTNPNTLDVTLTFSVYIGYDGVPATHGAARIANE